MAQTQQPIQFLKYFGGYWYDPETDEHQPRHQYERAMFGLGDLGGPMHTEDCPGCAWMNARLHRVP